MISELYFIKTYNSFWNQLLFGAEDYVKAINSTGFKSSLNRIGIDDTPNRRILINNISFSLFKKAVNDEIKLQETNDIYLIQLAEKEKILLSNVKFSNALNSDLNSNEIEIIKEISKRLFEKYIKKNKLLVSPKFNGCGMLFSSYGDLIYNDNTLVEVKAGDRNFNTKDLRQLYTYVALNYASTNVIFENIELFNPRTGKLWKENIEVVSNSISEYSTIEIIDEILKFIQDGMYFEID
jgi:hypothetical protein